MTIRTGDSYIVETLDQFRKRLNVSWTEIAESLSDSATEKLLQEANIGRQDQGLDKVESVADIHDENIEHFVREYFDITEVILATLSARDREYVHIHELSTHRIVELTPEPESNDHDIGSAMTEIPERLPWI